MESEIALYYPYIHFQDDTWLKKAVLYWDKISRIVPYGYDKLHDSDVVKKLKYEGQSIIDSEPSHHAIQIVSKELLDVINIHGEALIQHLSPEPFLYEDKGSLAYLYHTKMDYELVEALEQSGLGSFRQLEGDADTEWLGVHPKIGHAYMTALASIMGSRRSFSVVSDNPNFTVAGCGFSVRQLFENLIEDNNELLDEAPSERAQSILGLAAVESVLPQNIESIPVEKIVQFRNNHVAELDQYRETVAAATTNLMEVTDAEGLHEHLENYGQKIHRRAKALQGKMDALFGNTVLSMVGLSKDLPDLASLGIAAAGVSLSNPVVVTAGIAFNACTVIRDKRLEMKELRENPFSFLVSLEQEFGDKGLLDKLRLGARRLLLD